VSAPQAGGGGAIVVCADDFGLSEPTSAVILDLLQRGAINATTCLVEAGDWAAAAPPLRRLTQERSGLAVGLHLNLTQPLPGCADPRLLAPTGRQLVRAFAARTEGYEAALFESFRAQWAAFTGRLDRPPDFIDGHEHVHLFPAARTALLRLVIDTGFSGWVRQCRTSSHRVSWKRLVLDPLSRRLSEDLARLGLTANPGFGGLRQFDPSEDVEGAWRTDLEAMRDGGLLMVHPGAAESGDPIGACRAQEAALLADGAMGRLLADLGLGLAADAVRAW
jgi:predicted glycoside hydrolase/deacetylase ChbG (UPF0249 family)